MIVWRHGKAVEQSLLLDYEACSDTSVMIMIMMPHLSTADEAWRLAMTILCNG